MSPFKLKVIDAVKKVPYGMVASYGQIALMVGVPRAAIQVGGVLNGLEGNTPVPWWRIINNSGKITIKGSMYTPSDQKKKLEEEDVEVSEDFTIDIERYRYRPTPEEIEEFELEEEYVQKIMDKYVL